MEPRLLQPGRNCWRLAPCRRAAFLVDGESYFSAFIGAVEKARHSVFILGWDIDSRLMLRRDGRPGRLPNRLGPFLDAVVAARRGLHIYVLDWDFALLYAFEREFLPLYKLGWRTHRRLHFHLDARHPLGASHHQKIVVIDDAVAFAGGLDLAQMRWDTPAHSPNDPRRFDNGISYPPFHDVQMVVDGEAAAALGELSRQRWQEATGKRLSPSPTGNDPWPPAVAADLREVEVGVVRTVPEYNGQREVREVERLYLDAIAAARTSIYIENQYFTSAIVGEALAGRLREKQGPEVVLVLPRECSGWLEQSTMGALRARLLRQLREADRYHRLGVFYPHSEELKGGEFINIHSKVLVMDERLVRVGSSNLSNRSMGLDTECDLVVEADREETRLAIAGFRNRLLAEHLGTEAAQVAEAVASAGSLLQGIGELNGGRRNLTPLESRDESWLEQVLPEWAPVDPERPIPLDQFVEEVVARDPERGVGRRINRRWIILAALLIAGFGLAAAWRWTPLGEWIDLPRLLAWGDLARQSSWGPILVISAFVLGGISFFPVTLLILVTALVFPPLSGVFYALLGCLVSAAVSYGLGRVAGRQAVERFAGSRLNRLSRQLARRGMIAVTVVRFLPVAPFSMVNLMAGASHIRFRDFIGGTLLGMAPGVVAITVFEHSLVEAIRQPQARNFLLLAAVVLLLIGSTWLLRRWLVKREAAPEDSVKGDGVG